MVVRDDSTPGFTTGGPGSINLGNSRRGSARVVSLKAFENDVLHALAREQGVDGLPGLDAEGAIYVIRRRNSGGCNPLNGMSGPTDFGMPTGGQYMPAAAMYGTSSLPSPAHGAAEPYAAGNSYEANNPYGVDGAYGPSAEVAQPVIRFQSPTSDYRSNAARSGGGHAIFAGTGANAETRRNVAGVARGGSAGHSLTQRSASPVQFNGLQTSGNYRSGGFGTMPAAGLYGQQPAAAYHRAGPGPIPNGGYQMTTPPGSMAMTMPAGPASQTDFQAQARHLSQQELQMAAAVHGVLLPPGPHPASQSSFGIRQVAAIEAAGVVPTNYPVQSSPHMLTSEPLPHVDQQLGAYPPAAMSQGGWDSSPYFGSMIDGGMTSTIDGPGVLRIPVRVAPGEQVSISESDVTLYDGDIVFIEARNSEVFYTGGLLGGGQYTLPRDYDLRALEAISLAQSGNQQTGGGRQQSSGGASALNQDVTISASRLIIVRRLDNGTRVPIEIDLNKAKRDMTGRQNVVIQPGDYLYLQYGFLEGVGAFFERHLLEGALFGVAGAQLTTGN
jgi:hypothetical protein